MDRLGLPLPLGESVGVEVREGESVGEWLPFPPPELCV